MQPGTNRKVRTRIVAVWDGEIETAGENGEASCDCIFWNADGCGIYESRPIQCVTYPFWDSILASSENWEEEAGVCPGMGRGKLWTGDDIRKMILARRAEGNLVLKYGVDLESADEDSLLGGEGLGAHSPNAY